MTVQFDNARPVVYVSRWWTNRNPMQLITASSTTNEVAWRGHPAGTVMIEIEGTRRGRMWEVHARFTSKRYGWSVRITEGHVNVYARSRFADIVPQTAKLKQG